MKKEMNKRAFVRIWEANGYTAHLAYEGISRKARLHAIEVERGETVIRLEAFNRRFEQVVVLDTTRDVYLMKDVFNGNVAASVADEYALAKAVVADWYRQGDIIFKEASIVHHADDSAKDKDPLDPPYVEYAVDDIVYGEPIGTHGTYTYHERVWAAADRSDDPNIRLLGQMKARVFPRYARKAYAGRTPGDFIGLGGPDAHLFRGDRNVELFVRENTRLAVRI